jgi:hypothetical protein
MLVRSSFELEQLAARADCPAILPQLSATTGRFTVEILEFQQRGDNYADRRERKYDEVDYRQRETLD